MKPIRLAVVLFAYGALVVVALLATTIMFTIMIESTAKSSATNLLGTAMHRNLRLIGNYVSSYENVTQEEAIGMHRFDTSAEALGGTTDMALYKSPWDVITIGQLNMNRIISTFEMWREKDAVGPSVPWYTTGCAVHESRCYFYNPALNETRYVPGNFLKGIYDVNNTVVQQGPPPLYQRHTDFMEINAPHIPREGLWSPMYIEFTDSSTPAAAQCGENEVSLTLTYYFCMDWLELEDDQPAPASCRHILATRTDASHLGELQGLELTPSSATYVLSYFMKDYTSRQCFAPPRVENALTDFVQSCSLSIDLTGGGSYLDRQPALQAECRNTQTLAIDKTDVMMTAAMTTTSGLFIVVIDVIPRDFFFSLVDQGKRASITISTVVCVIAGVVSVLSWLAIVVPIQWISCGLRKAATLSSEPESLAHKAKRYTFIYEVDVLYESYVELRTALTELKAYVPQGLFVAPSTREMYSDAMLMALFGSSSQGSLTNDLFGMVNSTHYAQAKDGEGDAAATSVTSATSVPYSTTATTSSVPSPSASSTSLTRSQSAVSPVTVNQSYIELSVLESAAARGLPSPRGNHHSRQPHILNNNSFTEGVTAKHQESTVVAAAGDAGDGRPPASPLERFEVSTGGENNTMSTNLASTGSAGIVQVFPVSQTDYLIDSSVQHKHYVSSSAHTRDLLRDAGLLPNGAAGAAADAGRGGVGAGRRRRHYHHHHRCKVNSKGGGNTPNADEKGNAILGATVKDFLTSITDGLDVVSSSTILHTNEAAMPKSNSGKKKRKMGGEKGQIVEDETAASAKKRSISGVGDSPSAASLELNLNQSDVNTFRHISCSFLILSFSFRYANTDRLESTVTELMDVVVKAVLRCGGVIEIFRPDMIAASFGAHASMNRHAQFATLCAVTIMTRIPSKQKPLTRIAVDSGVFYVGNCGAHGRSARVVFGDRFDFALDLMKFEIGLGRVLCTDGIAVNLPPSFVVPVDYIVPLRNRVHGIQLFQVLNPSRRHDKLYHDGANRFRAAYNAAVTGNLAKARAVINEGQLYDPELGAYFAGALKYLMGLNPPRPRYCRFQLPQFELLGCELKERTAKYQYEKLALEDFASSQGRDGPIGSDPLPSINFGFGDSICEHSGDTLDPASLSRGFIHRSSNDFDDTDFPGGSGGPLGPSDRGDVDRLRSSQAAGNSMGAFGGFFDFDTSVSSSELPRVIVDHKGQTWYRMPKPIGTGAFAEVYKALSSNGTVMALKCIQLSSSNVQLADVVSEVNTACKLFNDHIVNYTGWAHVGSYLVIIMDFIAGGSLHAALSAFPRGMPVQLAKRYASDTLKGLAYLHRNGIVHADIKPQNILLSADGACRLGDFGSSVTKANALSCGNDVFNLRGTPQYMSPEVAAGATPTMASDIWSFGVTLYEMLTGTLPWRQKKLLPLPKRRPSMLTSVFAAPAAGALAEVAVPADAAGVPVSGGSAATVDETPLPIAVAAGKGSNAGQRTGQTKLSDRAVPGGAICSDSRKSAAAQSQSQSPTVAEVCGESMDTAEFELVEVQGVSDVRFVQGLANGTIVSAVLESELPSQEAYVLLSRCLKDDPVARPTATEIMDNIFFLL